MPSKIFRAPIPIFSGHHRRQGRLADTPPGSGLRHEVVGTADAGATAKNE
jgi:hypothetical protein